MHAEWWHHWIGGRIAQFQTQRTGAEPEIVPEKELSIIPPRCIVHWKNHKIHSVFTTTFHLHMHSTPEQSSNGSNNMILYMY